MRPFAAPILVVTLGLLLGSCGSFSSAVSDHWPHWAGGLPADAPPRRGAPGYDEFIAHNPQAAADPAKPVAGADPRGQAPAAPADERSGSQGGLY